MGLKYRFYFNIASFFIGLGFCGKPRHLYRKESSSIFIICVTWIVRIHICHMTSWYHLMTCVRMVWFMLILFNDCCHSNDARDQDEIGKSEVLWFPDTCLKRVRSNWPKSMKESFTFYLKNKLLITPSSIS